MREDAENLTETGAYAAMMVLRATVTSDAFAGALTRGQSFEVVLSF